MTACVCPACAAVRTCVRFFISREEYNLIWIEEEIFQVCAQVLEGEPSDRCMPCGTAVYVPEKRNPVNFLPKGTSAPLARKVV